MGLAGWHHCLCAGRLWAVAASRVSLHNNDACSLAQPQYKLIIPCTVCQPSSSCILRELLGCVLDAGIMPARLRNSEYGIIYPCPDIAVVLRCAGCTDSVGTRH